MQLEAQRLAERLAALPRTQRLALLRRLAQQGVDTSALPIVPFRRDEPLPASHAQRALWLTWRMAPESAAYNLAGTLVLRGALDVGALAAAVEDLAERHEVLRTVLRLDGQGDLQQLPQPRAAGLLRVEALSAGTFAEREAQAHGRVQQHGRQPFDLEAGPVWRVLLLRLDGATHWLSIVLHHIVADGWSESLLVQDLAALYEARMVGRTAALPPLPVQFADHAAWQYEAGEAGGLERQLAHWQRRLGDLPQAPLPLPLDRPRPAVRSDAGGVHAFVLPDSVASGVRRLAESSGCSVFMVMLALLKVVLARSCGAGDICVGTPVADRARAETHRLVGYFTNVLVLRTQVRLDTDFRALLAAVRETVLDAHSHADCPFDLLVSQLAPEREAGVHPLFQVKCTEQQDAPGLDRFGALVVSARGTDAVHAHFDLSLDFTVRPREIACEFAYAADIFDAPTAACMAQLLADLVTRVVSTPERPLRELLPAVALSQVLGEARPQGAEDDVVACWDRQVAAAGDAPALRYEEQLLSRAELDARAQSLAAQLVARGVGPEVRVGVHAPRSVDLVIGMLAVLKAGGVYVPLDPALPADRLSYQVSDSGMALMLSTQALPWSPPIAVLPLTLAAGGDSVADRFSVKSSPRQGAYLIYTSGSTGRPKGVLIDRGALANYVRGVLERLELPQDAASMAMVSTVAADLGHTVLFGALCSGRLLHMIAAERALDPDRFADYMGRHRIDVLKIVPSHLQALLNARESADVLPRQRLVLGGEATRWPLLDRIACLRPQLRVVNHYGPTETTVGILTQDAAAALRSASTLPVGRPLPNSAVHVLDADLAPMPQGIAGELYLGGAGLAQGYAGRAGMTAERFVANPFAAGERLYRSGDRVRLLPDGSLEFLGRVDDQVKVRGYRVELKEITQSLLAHPGVCEAEVVARSGSEEGSTRLLAYAVAAAGTPIDGDALREHLAQRLPEYMVPAAVMVLDAMPLNANGKLDRKALPEPGPGGETAYEAPVGEVEKALAAVWSEVLGIERIGRQDNFFALGGDSILSLKVVARARKRGVPLSPRQLFEGASLSALAASVLGSDASAPQEGAIPVLDAAQRALALSPSYAQLRQWFLWKLDEQSTAYHIAGGLKLQGVLDEAALRGSLQALVARHEALRTVFRANADGQPEQILHERMELSIPLIDLSGVEPGERQAQARQQAQRVSETPFDLGEGPLLRAALIRLGLDEHILVVVMHHIVSDGWSLQLVVGEFVAQYRARILGEPLQQPALPIQYADYAAWQKNWLDAGERERQLAYWTAQLGGPQPVLQLTTDHPRQAEANYRAARHSIELPAALVQSLQRRAQTHAATLFMALLAGWQTLLHRYTGQQDIRVGVPIANRHRVETEGVVGLFVNTQVLRGAVNARMSLEQLLTQAKDTALAAQAHQDLPFEQLVQALQPERSLGHSPLFQVLFNHQREDYRALAQLPGLALHSYELGEQAAQFELTLDTTEKPDGSVWASFSYARELFEAGSIQRLAGHYLAVLQALAETPHKAVGDIEILSESEKSQLRQWGVNEQTYSNVQPVHRQIEQQVQRTPEAIALVFGDVQLSYAELNTRANRLAHRLMAQGVRAETKVGLALERGVQMVVGLLAILKAGGAYVPLDPEYPAERLAYMVRDSGIALVLANGPQQLGQEHGQAWGAVPVLALDTLVLDGEPASDPTTEAHGQQLAYVIYTSGSTGKPKGVMVRHHALAHFIRGMQQAPGLSAQDTLVAVTSLSFDIAALELYLPLTVGARIVLASRETTRDGIALAQLVEQSRATVLQSTPAGWRMLRAAGWPSAPLLQFKGLCGGEALQPDLAQDLNTLGMELWNMYGPTETTIWSAAARVAGATPDVSGAIAATQLYVLDEGLQPVAANVPGELYLGGVGLARGYARRAALTAERFVADPFGTDVGGARLYRTGDLVRWRASGRLEFLGRMDHQVKIRGFRIELGEIEAQLLAQSGVREAVVVAQEGPAGARLLAYIAAGEGAAIDVSELREQLGQSLPEYMVPSAIVRLEKLPLNGNGKVDRNALPQMDVRSERVYEPPQGAVEQALAAIWAEVLGAERVGREDNFFELGGHSLLAARMVARLRVAFHIDLKLRKVFELPVLRELATCFANAQVQPGQRSEARPLVPVPRSSAMRLSPAQRRLWAVDRVARGPDARDRAAYNMPAALRLEGAIDLDALRAALNALVTRHEILRTSYREGDDGDPVAVIAPQLHIEVPLMDLTDVEPEIQQARVREVAAAHAGQVFDLASGPLLRSAVLKLGAGRHVLLLCVHHIAFDGWSEAVFTKEFVALYGALQAPAVPEHAVLPPLAVQYADYADWHARRLDDTLEADTAFWRSYLAGAPGRSTLPSDHPRSPSASRDGDVLELHISRELTDALARLARAHKVSLFTLLLAAFELLLHRQAQADDLVLGTDVAGRNHPALEGLMGFFVNVLPLRSRLLKGLDFLQWLSCTQAATLDALEHQDMPFDQIVEVAGIPRERQGAPLVQVLFVMQNAPESRFELPGLRIESLAREGMQAKFDLAVFVSEVPGGLRADWVFPKALYRRGTVEQAAGAWRDLLQQICAAPTTMLEDFVIPPNQELPMRTEMMPPTSMLKMGKLQKLNQLTAQPGTPQQRALHAPVRTSFLSPQRQFPIVMQPTGGDIDPVAWAREQKDFIETALCRHGGILFRNFGLRTPQEFEAFAETIEPQLYGGYGDLPKKEGGRNTYRSTPYPERQMILFHNESAHLERWPRKQWFFCELPSPVGGATPIVDCREMLHRLPPELVDRLEHQQLLYVRTFTRRLDVSWQDFFKTDVRAEVEQRLAAAGTDWEWLDGDNLQTRTRCPAVIRHPVTGERAFFNQVQLHHVHCLEPEVREDLLSMVGLERMPRHVYYGDGTPITDETMDIIGRAYEDCAVRFDWKQGDVVMLDNMLAAHARDPYEGPRKIVVAMGEMFERARLNASGSLAAPIHDLQG